VNTDACPYLMHEEASARVPRTSVGLSTVHARTITVAVIISETGEIIEKAFEHDPGAVAVWASGLPASARAVYEARPYRVRPRPGSVGCGRILRGRRALEDAPPAGDGAKTDRGDAR